MPKTKSCDIVILGCGIAGLLLGSELSKRHSVVMIEKSPHLPQNKYWLTNTDCLAGNEELETCIDTRYSFMDFIANDQTTYRCPGQYILWNTNRLTGHLRSRIRTQKGVLLNDYRFYNFYYTDEGISVLANDTEFKAKLVIDAMGYASPIIYAKGIVDITGYYMLYGAVLEAKTDFPPICLSNLLIHNRPKYFEAFPTSNGRVYAVLMMADKSVRPTDDLADDFKFIVEKSIYSSFFKLPDTFQKPLYGVVPAGKLKVRALDRLFFFGEAGQMNPAATGTCLTRMMYGYKKTATFLSQKIDADKLQKADLEHDDTYMDGFNQRFQRHLFSDVLTWNSDQFTKLVRKMQSLPPSLVNDILFGELHIQSCLSMENLFNLIRHRNFFVLRPLIKALF